MADSKSLEGRLRPSQGGYPTEIPLGILLHSARRLSKLASNASFRNPRCATPLHKRFLRGFVQEIRGLSRRDCEAPSAVFADHVPEIWS